MKTKEIWKMKQNKLHPQNVARVDKIGKAHLTWKCFPSENASTGSIISRDLFYFNRISRTLGRWTFRL